MATVITPDRAERRRGDLLEQIQNEDQLLLKLVRALPEDKLTWKPDAPKCWQANDLALHAAAVGNWFTTVVDGAVEPGKEPPPAPTDKTELLTAIEHSQNQFQQRVAEFSPEELAGTTEFFGNTFPNITILSWHRDHMIHHKGQLALYLRLMGAKVPSTYGPSGDEDYAPAEAAEAGA